MRRQLCLALLGSLTVVATANAAIVTDTFTRSGEPTTGWGTVDNGSVGGETGTIAASYIPDTTGSVDGGVGTFTNTRVILDYNLAADPDVIAGGGFIVEFTANPSDGDVQGIGRDFAGVALTDTNDTVTLGGAGLVNGGNTSSRFALTPRNSGSVGYRQFTSGGLINNLAGNPASAGFNEQVFDQPTFDAYSADLNDLPDPFANDSFYDVKLVVRGDFSVGSVVTIDATVDGVPVDFDLSDADIDPSVIEWGDNAESVGNVPTGAVFDQAYLVFAAFQGPHQYDNLRITAIPEPGAVALAACGLAALIGVRSRER